MQKNKAKNLIIFGLIALLSFVFFANFAWALDVGIAEVAEEIGLGGGDPRVIAARIVRSFLSLLGIIALVLILYGGFTWMTAGGDDEKIAKAKKILINAVIGLAIILTSFAITQFILNSLLEATGVTPGPGPGPGGPGGLGGPGVRVFQVKSMSPQGAIPIRNVTVRVLFNTNVDDRTVEGNMAVTRVSDGVEVDGAYTTFGSRVSFVPDQVCPSPNKDRKCFDSDTEYRVKVFEGLRSSGGMYISCSGFGAVCEGTFTTGDLVDVDGPSVDITYPDDGQGVPINSFITLQAYAEDDAGISIIDFEVDGAIYDTDGPPPPTPTTFTGEASWDTSFYELGSRHDIAARAYDIDDNDTRSGTVSVVVRAEHCFNGVQDGDETGDDCGGIAPDDPDWCGACPGAGCTTNEDCSHGYCVDGVCVALPIIESVDPLDGAVGNFVTIGGQYFGAARGSVRFLGAPEEGDEVTASLAPCDGAWGNNQIVITIPKGAVSGPLEVRTSGDEADLTDDTRGPVIPDFLINTVQRPGICRLSPDEGEQGTIVVISGQGFGGTEDQVLFGEVEAGRIDSWSDARIEAVVPPLTPADYAVRVTVAGAMSNGVNFAVTQAGLAGTPVIAQIDPPQGPPGQYVTIRGDNFGSSVGRIIFTNPSTGQTALADFNFPEECGDDFWFRESITFKVPDEYNDATDISLAAHGVKVVRSDGRASEEVDFTVNDDPLSPGICRIRPNVGPEATGVTIYGERLGDSRGAVSFYDGVGADVTTWADEEILSAVPVGAKTGPVTATSSAGVASNGLNFRVESCLDEPDACEVDQQCCPDGSCVGIDEECAIPPSQASFVWRFSTGIIPITPQVIESCMAEDLPASPSPWSERSGGENVCVNAIPTVRFNVPMDITGFNTSNIQFKKCVGLSDSPCDAVADVAVSSIFPINDNRGFQIQTTADFDTDSWYEIKLATRLRGDESVGSLEMEENADECGEGFGYCFRWKTSLSDGLCTIGQAAVNPAYKVKRDLDPQPYNVAAIAGEDICIAIDASDYDWLWQSSDILKARVSVPNSDEPHLAQAEPVLETRGEPVEISAEAAGVRDAGLLEIDFTDPVVVINEPECDEACLNAVIRVRFNTLMQRESILAPGNIQILKCENENCRYFTGGNLVTGINALDQDTWQEILVMHPDFEAHKYYRVILSDKIKSYTLTNLTGLNWGDNFSWTFRTKDARCGIDIVEMQPVLGLVNARGEKQAFRAVPRGEADECSTEGLILDSYDYNWVWRVLDTAVGRLVGGGMIDTSLDSVSPWCGNMSCLHLGTEANVAVCGNGSVETTMGEECDDANTIDDDGCSSNCLVEPVSQVGDGGTCGNANVEDLGYISPWRNSWIEGAEECDDGNDINSDGCSAGCQNEGSTLGGSVCGNSDLGDGEDCDDGNRRSGDGCSPECLREGSRPGPLGVCGNGTAETDLGEDCDDGRMCANAAACVSNIDCAGIGDGQCRPRSGDGCSQICLNEGSYPCAEPLTDLNCCGNARLEAGEDCDGGEGCGLNCLKIGSSAYYSSASYCGDGTVGTGEEAGCEISAGDGRTDGLQIVEAVGTGTVDEDGLQTTLVQAIADGQTGEATFGLQCGFTLDAECKAIDRGLGLAANSCCYPMPAVRSVIPTDGSNDICLNAKVQLTFNLPIDINSLRYEDEGVMKDRILLIKGKSDACGEGEEDYIFASLSQEDLPWWQKVWQGIKNLLARIFGRFAAAVAPGDPYLLHYCEGDIVDGEVMASNEIVSYRLKELLESDAWYQIRVLAGLKTEEGVVLGRAYASTFGTGTEICKFDFVKISDPAGTYVFNEKTARTFIANAMSRRSSGPEAIEEIPGLYEWEWMWATGIDDTTEENIITSANVDRNDSEITPAGINGEESLIAQGGITLDKMFGRACVRDSDCAYNDCVIAEGEEAGQCAGEVIGGSETIFAMLCENPWPDPEAEPILGNCSVDRGILCRDDGDCGSGQICEYAGGAPPYFADPNLWHFATMYCRDNEPSLLPELEAHLVAELPGVLEDYLLTYKGAEGSDAPWARDAIGLRIMPNPEHLSPEEWYEAQGFGGAPQSIEIDGYPAIKFGTSVYVGAANKVGGATDIYTNIYILSYNEGAHVITQNIYNQFLSNLVLNYNNVSNEGVCKDKSGAMIQVDGKNATCTHNLECMAIDPEAYSDAYCDADKDKLRRDTKRVSDALALERSFEVYRVLTGGRRTCVLGETDLGLECMRDSECAIIDAEARCKVVGGSVPDLQSGSFLRSHSTSLWPSWQATLGNAVGQSLINDPVNQFGICENGYDQSTCFDSGALQFMCPRNSLVYQYHAVGGTDYQIYGQLEFGDALIWSDGLASDHIIWNENCENTILSNTNLCGDGLLGPEEECELGQTKRDRIGCAGDEVRDISCIQEGTTCRWSRRGESGFGECALTTVTCGNGVREGYCVTGPDVGLLCRSDLDCVKSPCRLVEACDDGANNGRYGFCNYECTGSGAYCGDGRLAGAEECDLGDAEHRACMLYDRGICILYAPMNGDYASGCSWDCRIGGPRCGDTIVQSVEQCEGDESEKKTTGFCEWYPMVDCNSDEDCPGRTAGNYCRNHPLVKCNPRERGACPGELEACDYERAMPNTPCAGACALDSETGYETHHVRTCNSETCAWGDWSEACVTDNACGNGILEGDEECDDGNTDNSDGCVIVPGQEHNLSISCKIAYCDDGYQYVGVETCDAGSGNGIQCTARYGETCTYCTSHCNFATATGHYCGDGIKELGVEECDEGPVACWYSFGYNPDTGPMPCNPIDACPIVAVLEGGIFNYYSGECQGQGISLAHVPAVPPDPPLDYGYNEQYCDSTCHVARRESPRCGDGIVQSSPYPPVPWDYPELYSPVYQGCDVIQKDLMTGWDIEIPSDERCPGDYVCKEGINLAETPPPLDKDFYCFESAHPEAGSVIENIGEVCDSGENSGVYAGAGERPNCNATCTAFAPFCGDGKQDTGEVCDWGELSYHEKQIDLVIVSSLSSYAGDCNMFYSVKSACAGLDAAISQFSGSPYNYDIEKTFYLMNDQYERILSTEYRDTFENCVDKMITTGGVLEETDGTFIKELPALTPRPHLEELCSNPDMIALFGECRENRFTRNGERPRWATALIDIAAGHNWRANSLKLILVLDNNYPYYQDDVVPRERPGFQILKLAWHDFADTYYRDNLKDKPRFIVAYDKLEDDDQCLRAILSGTVSTLVDIGLTDNMGGVGKYLPYVNSVIPTLYDNIFNSIFCDPTHGGVTQCSCLHEPCL